MLTKIDDKNLNFIEYYLYYTNSKLVPILHELGFIPNDITTISLLLSLIGIYFIYKKQTKLGIFFMFISYYLDATDGYMARYYKQYSVFGDWYDHITDWVSWGIIIIILFFNLQSNKNKYIYLIISLIISTLYMIQIGCEEELMAKENTHHFSSSTLYFFRSLCTKNPDRKMRVLKYFSATMFISYLLLLIYITN